MIIKGIYECSEPLPIDPEFLPAIGKLYPYGTLDYTTLGSLTKRLLRTGFPDLPPETHVVAISAYNWGGRQWGIVLIRKPNQYWWKLVAQFGHGRHWRRYWKIRCWLVRIVLATGFWEGHTDNWTLEHPRRLDELREEAV